jgi:hypothetical protein
MRALVIVALAAVACAAAPSRSALRREAQQLAKAQAQGSQERMLEKVWPPLRARVAASSRRGPEPAPERGRGRGRGPKPVLIERATVVLGPGEAVEAVCEGKAWGFREDPLAWDRRDTPRAALRALVVASRLGRWDVLLALAPRRYRLGLSEADLERAWGTGPQGDALRAARDRVARALPGPIEADADEATLRLEGGSRAQLEREGANWVVVDF